MLCRPTQQHPVNAHLDRLNTWRSWLGAAAITAAYVRWSDTGHVADDLVNHFAESLLRAFITAGSLLLLAAVLFVLITHSGHRRTVAYTLRTPLLAVFIPIAVIAASMGLTRYGQVAVWPDADLAVVLFAMAVLFVLTFAMFGVMFAIPVMVRHAFRSADGHPLLRPTVVAGVAIVSIVVAAVGGGGSTAGMPTAIVGLIAFVGPLVVLGLCAYEVKLLQDAGVRWRTPWP